MLTYREQMAVHSYRTLRKALEETQGHKGHAAERLGVHRNTFTRLHREAVKVLRELKAKKAEEGVSA